jgi:chromosome segregation ATPase
MQTQPAPVQGAQHSPHNSYQTTQSYKAYDPRSAVPATAISQRQDSRSPRMSESPRMSDLAHQNAELTEQVKDLRVECDRRTTAVEDMLTAVLDAEGLLAEKEAEVVRLSAELDQKTSQFSKTEELFKNRQINNLQEEAHRLSTANTNTALAENHNAELSDLRQSSLRLHEQLTEKDELLKQMTTALRAWESGWQSHMQKEKEKLEATIESKYAYARSELTDQTSRLEVAEARSRAAEHNVTAALAQVEAQKTQSQTYLQQLTDLQRSHATLSQQFTSASSKSQMDSGALEKLQAELNEARKLGAFFKKNSEQTSKTSKEVAAANRALQESMTAKTREVEEQESLIQALRLQLGDVQMVG